MKQEGREKPPADFKTHLNFGKPCVEKLYLNFLHSTEHKSYHLQGVKSNVDRFRRDRWWMVFLEHISTFSAAMLDKTVDDCAF